MPQAITQGATHIISWNEVWNIPEKAAPIISSVGILLAGTCAVATLIFVGLRGLDSTWNDNYRKLYDEFWLNDTIAIARKYIVYDDYYCDLKTVLDKINSNNESGITPEEIDIIEYIDRFFAKCVQFTVHASLPILAFRKKKFRKIFLHYWYVKMRQRPELIIYMRDEWPSLIKAYEIEESKPLRIKAKDSDRENSIN